MWVSIHVRRFDTSLVDGIKIDKFDAVKTRISTSVDMLRSDFEACVTLYQDYIRQTSKKGSSCLRLKCGANDSI